MTTPTLPLRLLKLRFWDEHVHAVPSQDLVGCPFNGPGVDLRGSEARHVFEGARDLVRRLHAFEPKIQVRAVSLDFSRPRLTATFDPLERSAVPLARSAVPLARSADSLERSALGPGPRDRPRVVRIDAPGTVEPLFDAAILAVERAGLACGMALARRTPTA